MNENQYWKWMAEYVEHQIATNPFKQIPAFEPRKKASEAWGFRMENWIAVAEWQTKHQARINRIINRVAKRHGLRLDRKSRSYARLIPIAANKGISGGDNI